MNSSQIFSRGLGVCRRIFRLVRNRLAPVHPNLLGDRAIEWQWVAAHVPPGPGRALDFGGANTDLCLAPLQQGYAVTTVDLGGSRWAFRHPDHTFVQGDILTLDLPEGTFDLVLNCSTIEHVGLTGRYGNEAAANDGDLEAMGRLATLMKPGGTMIMTIPVGVDAVHAPYHRIYGEERLPRLLAGFAVEKEAHWRKPEGNVWVPATRAEALAEVAVTRGSDPLRDYYALGCFVLRKPAGEPS